MLHTHARTYARTHARTYAHTHTHIHTHHYLRRILHWSFHPVCQWFWKIISVFVVTIFFKPLMLELFFSRCNSQISCWRQLKKHPAQRHYLVSISIITLILLCCMRRRYTYCIYFKLCSISVDGWICFFSSGISTTCLGWGCCLGRGCLTPRDFCEEQILHIYSRLSTHS